MQSTQVPTSSDNSSISSKKSRLDFLEKLRGKSDSKSEYHTPTPPSRPRKDYAGKWASRHNIMNMRSFYDISSQVKETTAEEESELGSDFEFIQQDVEDESLTDILTRLKARKEKERGIEQAAYYDRIDLPSRFSIHTTSKRNKEKASEENQPAIPVIATSAEAPKRLERSFFSQFGDTTTRPGSADTKDMVDASVEDLSNSKLIEKQEYIQENESSETPEVLLRKLRDKVNMVLEDGLDENSGELSIGSPQKFSVSPTVKTHSQKLILPPSAPTERQLAEELLIKDANDSFVAHTISGPKTIKSSPLGSAADVEKVVSPPFSLSLTQEIFSQAPASTNHNLPIMGSKEIFSQGSTALNYKLDLIPTTQFVFQVPIALDYNLSLSPIKEILS